MSSSAVTAGSPAFKRINRAMLCGGFSAFALLYCVQPLMPLLAHQFALTPSQSSWSLSIATLALAVSLVLSGALSDRIGRKKLMTFALVGAAVFTVLTAVAQNYFQLLVLRALLGFSMGGVPAVAMAYLSEEIEGPSLGLSMGLYISGTALGGMAGRVIASVVSDSTLTNGDMISDRADSGGAIRVAIVSGWRIAMRFGTSSPSTIDTNVMASTTMNSEIS